MSEFVVIDYRTQTDVNRVQYLYDKVLSGTATQEEWNEWNTDLIGAFNKSDMVRNNSNLITLGSAFGVPLGRTTVIPDFPTEDYFAQFREDLLEVWNTKFNVMFPYQNIPEQPFNTWQKWNAIEHIMKIMYDYYIADSHARSYAGDELYTIEDIVDNSLI